MRKTITAAAILLGFAGTAFAAGHENTQFSTTTKLQGNTNFVLPSCDDGYGQGRLNLDTSFTGNDTLASRLRGSVEVGAEFYGGDTDFYAVTDLRYRIPCIGGSDWGFKIDVDAIAFDDGYSNISAYPVFYRRLGQGKLSVGMPEPAIDMYVRLPNFARSLAWPGFSNAKWYTVYDSHYGIRYDGDFGDTRYGVSAHYFPAYEDTVITVGASKDLGPAKLVGGAEIYSDGQILTAGVRYRQDNLMASFHYINYNGEDSGGIAHVSYKLSDRCKLFGDYGFSEGGDNVLAVGGSYRLREDVMLNGSYVTESGGGSGFLTNIRYQF